MRKRHDIKELVENTDQVFLKDVWEEMYGAVTCPVCADGVLLKDGDVDYCSVCGTVFKTVKVVKQDVTQFDRAEALDRIHVIQTMLSELLFRNECKPHRGLSPYTAHLVEQVHEKLCEAYQRQAASWEWTDES